MKTVLAFDFGASSGRAVKGVFDGEKIRYEEIHRFKNAPLTVDGHICHDIPMMLSEIKTALDKAGNIDSLAFFTWGVDYALLDANGELLHAPYHYRDERTSGILEKAEKIMPRSALFSHTGNQIMNINTLFQLMCDENLKSADTLLFMPDLFSFLLTGNKVCEQTIASTSQMLDPRIKMWSEPVLSAFGINKEIFAPLVKTNTVAGEYNNVKVISAAGHDTQCAIAAMPYSQKTAAFLSCGTWSLIGCELDEPVLSEKAEKSGLSNELGANGKINFLQNISGLWLIQEFRRCLALDGKDYGWNELENAARGSTPFLCFIDPDCEELSLFGKLPQKLEDFCRRTNQRVPQNVGEYMRCIYESLALKYRSAIKNIEDCTNKKFEILHLFGGGANDALLCELAANALGIPVTAGPTEATALGNIILQLIALGEIKSVDEGRQILSKSESLKIYEPRHSNEWDDAYKKFIKLCGEN